MANKWAYYNEIDPHAAAWIRELIKLGHIADGVVDERSIIEVDANDVRGFLQCHWFAGIAGWSRALRLAGIGDDTPIWTGSCPCQPFSGAGKGDGFDDPRHLWPHFFRIISHLRPARVVGEQVASPDALVWWDAVCADLEGAGYAGWAADLCSAGIGAPHIRQRLYWVADADGWNPGPEREQCGWQQRQQQADGLAVRMAYAAGDGQGEERQDAGWGRKGNCAQGRAAGHGASGGYRWPSPPHGIRRDSDWLHCRDGKWRPVKPGLVPLVDGLPRGVVPSSRVGLAVDADKTAEARSLRLKGYGNAIDPELAAMFLRAVS